MVYNYTSCEVVIAQLISRIRITDTGLADDILDWLREGINLLRVRNNLVPQHKCLEVNDNVAKLPCGIVFFDGLFYNGQRLRLGTGVVDTRVNLQTQFLTKHFDSYFQTDTTSPGFISNEQSYLLIRGDDLRNVTSFHGSEFYIPYPNHIQASFKCGQILLFYRSMPVDDRGYPMIPDEENTRFALFWWLMASLTLTGYKHNDPRMDYVFCMSEYDKFAKVSKNKIGYWSIDKKESFLNYWVNLIPPRGYYDHFSINGEQPKLVGI